jgi:predicted dienelactone hydrolase
VWHDARRHRDVPAKLWSAGVPTGAPVVLVSHGIGENRDSYAYLGRALARAGFLAVHLTHAGTDRAVLEKGYLHLYRAVKEKENWVNRLLDVTFALDQLASDPRADVDRSAVVGHSAGAFTAFAAAGLETSGGQATRDARVKVIVPMSMPRLDGVVAERGYDGIGIPVLNITGTCDASLVYRTFPRHRRIPFERSSGTGHYLVTIRRVNHDTFSAQRARQHELIAALTVGFLRGFLVGDRIARAWFDDPGQAVVHGSELTVERK